MPLEWKRGSKETTRELHVNYGWYVDTDKGQFLVQPLRPTFRGNRYGVYFNGELINFARTEANAKRFVERSVQR